MLGDGSGGKLQLSFPDPERLDPPILQLQNVGFTYHEKEKGDPTKYLLRAMNFNIDMKTRVAIVGVNGAGKSTLLNLLVGKLRGKSRKCVLTRTSSCGSFHTASRRTSLDRKFRFECDERTLPGRERSSVSKSSRTFRCERKHGLTEHKHAFRWSKEQSRTCDHVLSETSYLDSR